jgi:kynureninase
MHYEFSEEFAVSQDQYDGLAKFRSRFHFPVINDKKAVYFTGNSLGLQPDKAEEYILQEINDWKKFGVEGHFHAKNPWFSYHEPFSPLLANVVGAKPNEVVAMGSLTNNLHLLMVSFYSPTKTRYKILSEQKAFPSDLYALDSQARFHGFDPKDAVVEIAPREGETILRPEDILKKIEELGDSLAMVMMGGVNYYTGQFFPLKEITDAGHKVGAIVGFDLAHAAGNINLKLHDWNIDFAAWCGYKYLNSGPGSVAGIYIHEKHHSNTELPRFDGWWGNKADTRFKMGREFHPFITAEAWQLSNAPVFSMAVHRASLEIYNEAGMEALCDKSMKLTGYTEALVEKINIDAGKQLIQILTPTDPTQRGCQLSLVMKKDGRKVFDELLKEGIITDWREPDVIRLAPVPLYNSFKDSYDLYTVLRKILLS